MTGLPSIAAAETVTREVVLASGWPAWVRYLVGGAALAIFLLAVWNVRQARPRYRAVALALLRLLLLSVLLGMFLEPALQEERTVRHRNHVVVLVDDSRSMGTPHGDLTRRGHAVALLEEHATFWQELGRDRLVHIVSFAGDVHPFDRENASEELRAQGAASDILGALSYVRKQFRDQHLAGVLLISDGVDTEELGARTRGAAGLDAETLDVLETLDAPIYTFGIRGSSAVKDIAVEELRVSDFAFYMNRTSIDAVVSITGYEEGELAIRLLEDGRQVGETVRALGTGVKRIDVSFPVVPQRLGKHVYTLAVDPLEGEITVGNNTQSDVLRVLRDRIRVLQIAGHPSWDVRFLRSFLKRTPAVDLISFFILVSPTNVLAARAAETSLIPFPAEELFVQELGGFDVVILQDFNYGPFSTRKHLHRIRDYVLDGGSLLMIGGTLSFSAGDYYGTPLVEVLPTKLPPGRRPERTLSTARFRPDLTSAGRTHPIMQIGASAEETEALWESLPPLAGANLLSAPKEGAVVLAEHPALYYHRKHRPVLAVREVGKGRVMAFGSDSSWLWGITHGGQGGDPHVYDRFWGNAIRWLISDPELDLVRVATARPTLAPGEAIDAEVTVRRPDYGPAAGEPVRIQVWRRSGGDPGDVETVVMETQGTRTDADGKAALHYQPERAGVYEVVARAELGGLPREGRDVVAVLSTDRELANVVPKVPLMEWLAQASGGEPLAIDQPPPPLTLRPAPPGVVAARTYHDLWTSPWVLIAAVTLFGLEWWLRRRWGFL